MQNIDVTIANNARNILPVPLPANPTPTVDSPLNYGSDPYPMPLKPSSRKNDENQYCNTLEPSPRDQRLNVPYEGNKNCPEFKNQPYQKDSCYLYNSKSQGVVGIVCNQPGGSDNANFERGNQFGVDYNYDELYDKKKLEYTVEQPVQIPLELQNPMVMYDQSTFYPENNFFLRKNPDYLTYPLQQDYTENGIPTYVYPYKTLNPIYGNEIKKTEPSIIENFLNEENPNKLKHRFLFMIILGIIGILIFFFGIHLY
jgi:hypothetical protein